MECWVYLFNMNNNESLPFQLQYISKITPRIILYDFDSDSDVANKLANVEGIEIRRLKRSLYNDNYIEKLKKMCLEEAKGECDCALLLKTNEFFFNNKTESLIKGFKCSGYSAISTNKIKCFTIGQLRYSDDALFHEINKSRKIKDKFETSFLFNPNVDNNLVKKIDDCLYEQVIAETKNDSRITVGFCSIEKDENYINYLKEVFGDKCDVVNKYGCGRGKTLTQCLNEIINESENDTVILCHDDIEFVNVEKYHDTIGNMCKELFENNKDYGIIGVVGGTRFDEEHFNWANGDVEGHWIQCYKKEQKDDEHLNFGKLMPYDVDIVEKLILDGMFLAIRKDRIKTLFNETNKSFHYYDIEFCLENHLLGCKVGVTKAFLVRHFSEGNTEEYLKNKSYVLDKWKNIIPYEI